MNEQWASMLGYTLEELSPVSIQTWRDLAHPEDLQHSDRRLAEHFRGESDTYRCVVRVRHKEGHWVWILDSGGVVEWTQEASPLWVYGTHQDITEQKQLKASVEQSNRELSLILDSSPLLIFYKDEEGRHVFVNDAVATTLGLPKEQLVGTRSADVFSPEHAA
ncbi:MAG: PAS domain S-box protein, partial [Spirochaetes bacterium]|nr:PAS domain S-box protein [Spirochaetota bacterium]